MTVVGDLNEGIIMERLRNLPPDKRREVLDFLEFLELQEKGKKWIEFDEWAINLSREKGFSHLKEDDISSIVKDFRGNR